MSSWRVLTSLCLIFSLIDPSKEGCGDYLQLEEWTAHLNRTLPLAQNKDLNDLLYCTLKLAFKNKTENGGILFKVLHDCFEPETEKKTTCEGPSSRNISFYHLMCLVAKSQGYPPEGVPPEGCKYETVCELYRPESAVAAKTTTPITTATSATSAATSSSLNTTPAAPTTTAPPPSTPAPTTTASPPSTPPPTPTLVPVTTTDKHEGGNANSSTGTRESTNTKVMCLLIISVTLNFVLPLVVFLFMRQRTQHRTQNPPHQDESSVLDETCEDPDPLPLIQSTTKPDVHSPSADTPRNPCTAGNGLGSH